MATTNHTPTLSVVRAYDFMRNDCTMDIKCAACGHVEADKYAYNDDYYRYTVVPSRKCKNCEQLNADLDDLATPPPPAAAGTADAGLLAGSALADKLKSETEWLLSDDRIEAIREGDEGKYDDTFDAGERHGRAALATELLAAAQPPQPQQVPVGLAGGAWVPVGERLPEPGVTVLVCEHRSDCDISIATYRPEGEIYENDDEQWEYGDGGFWGTPSFWMPLPEQPLAQQEALCARLRNEQKGGADAPR